MAQPENKSQTQVYVIFNPVAGVQNPENTRALFEERFKTAGWKYTIYETTGEESIRDIVRKALAAGSNLIVAAGGDGTVAEVGSGVARSKVPMAIVPAGTGNSLARELGIPLDFTAALDLLVGENMTRQIDGMQVGDELYLLNVGVGVSVRSIRDTSREQKRRFGILAYLWNIGKQLTGIPLRRFDLKLDGRNIRIIASEILVLNCGIIGVQKLPEELHICPDDGRVDIYVVRAQSALDYLSVSWNLLMGGKKSHPKVQTLTAERMVEIFTHRPLTVQADGEVVGKTPVKVKVMPRLVSIVVPAQPLTPESKE